MGVKIHFGVEFITYCNVNKIRNSIITYRKKCLFPKWEIFKKKEKEKEERKKEKVLLLKEKIFHLIFTYVIQFRKDKSTSTTYNELNPISQYSE